MVEEKDNFISKPIVAVIILLALIVGGLVYVLGRNKNGAGTENELLQSSKTSELSNEEKMKILKNLKSAKTPELNAEEKAKVLKNLKTTKAPELSDSQKASILEALKNNR